MTQLIPEKINAPLCQLGEGLCWDSARQCMWWLDIELQKIYAVQHNTGTVSEWSPHKTIGMIAMMDTENLLVFAESEHGGELYEFNPDKDSFTPLTHNFTHGAVDVLVNDGAVDRNGGLVVGTKHTTCESPTASLYYTNAHQKQGRILRDNITVCNGPAFSPCGTKMYFADTPTLVINAYDYDGDTGSISNKTDFVTCPDGQYPDGMTTDADGFLWNGVWNGACVNRYAPNGTLDLTIALPNALNVTNVCFGGENLDTLYITTAYSGMTESQREQYPDSGATYVVNTAGVAYGVLDTPYGSAP